MRLTSVMDQILDLARWAPSGDNTQPWRFEVLDESHLIIHGFDTREHCVYDLDGHASQLSLGALIETLTIAATKFGLRADISRRTGLPDSRPTFDVFLVADAAVRESELIASIPARSVQRRAYSIRPLTDPEKRELESVLDTGYRMKWLEAPVQRWQVAKLMFGNAKLRLTMEEAYLVHRKVIDWGQRYSADRVPDQALGADAVTLRLMRWAMNDWRRIMFLNKFLAGTWLPRLQMDLLPAVMCAAHFVLLRNTSASSVDDYVQAGRMVQRLWLTITKLGLQHQPELTPLIFSRYVRDRVVFSQSGASMALASRLAEQALNIVGENLECAVWIGRIGSATTARARSTRLSLATLSASANS